MASTQTSSIFNFPPPLSTNLSNRHSQLQIYMPPGVASTPPSTPFSGYHLFYAPTSGMGGQFQHLSLFDGSLATPHNSPYMPQIHSACLPFYGLPNYSPTPASFNEIQKFHSQQPFPKHPGAKGIFTSSYKTALCQKFLNHGGCSRGDECRYAHGPAELRLPKLNHPKFKTVVCRNFAKDGECDYGVRCQFIHERGTPMGRVFHNSRYGPTTIDLSQKLQENGYNEPKCADEMKKDDNAPKLDINGNLQLVEASIPIVGKKKFAHHRGKIMDDFCENVSQLKLNKGRVFMRRHASYDN